MYNTVCLLASDESIVFRHLKGKLHFQKLVKKQICMTLKESKITEKFKLRFVNTVKWYYYAFTLTPGHSSIFLQQTEFTVLQNKNKQ